MSSASAWRAAREAWAAERRIDRGLAAPVALRQALALQSLVAVDQQHPIVLARALGLGQERHHRDQVGAARGGFELGGACTDGRMQDRFERGARIRIAEDEFAQRAAIQVPIAGRTAGPEALDAPARSSALPGATTSRAISSVSMIGTPSAANSAATGALAAGDTAGECNAHRMPGHAQSSDQPWPYNPR